MHGDNIDLIPKFNDVETLADLTDRRKVVFLCPIWTEIRMDIFSVAGGKRCSLLYYCRPRMYMSQFSCDSLI